MTNLVVMHGIGYVPDGSTLVSATPADYVAEIERLEREIMISHAINCQYEGGCNCEICKRLAEVRA